MALAVGPLFAQSADTVVAVAGRTNEHASIAADGEFVAIAWAATTTAGQTDVFAAVSSDAGASFSAPVRVNTVAGQARVNGEQPPRVAIVRTASRQPELVVLWTNRAGGGTALLMARSTNGGKAFGAARPVPGTAGAAGNRGWHSVTVDQDGKPYAVWLDHREAVASSAASSAGGGAQRHDHDSALQSPVTAASSTDGVARAQLSRLWFAPLDGGSPRPLTQGVCYCCKTALVSGQGGRLYAAWRHVYDGNRRDIAFAASRDGGRTFSNPARVSDDQWAINGCPENGPALAVGPGGRVHVAWPTVVSENGRSSLRLFHASAADDARFTPRETLPASGAAYHPAMAVSARGVPLIAWESLEGGARRIKVARGEERAGRHHFPRAEDFGPGVHPALVATARHAVMAWASRRGAESVVVVRRVRY